MNSAPTDPMREAFEKWCDETLDPNVEPLKALFIWEAVQSVCQTMGEALVREMEVAASKAERAARPKIERHWVTIKDVPEHVQSEDAKIALAYLIKHSDKVEMMQFPKDQSQYKAYFDDGVYKGCFVFAWTENGLNPLSVYEKLSGTGWPGFSMGWMKEAARDKMRALATLEGK